jgi:hypothetical protein
LNLAQIITIVVFTPTLVFSQRIDGKHGIIEYDKLEQAYLEYDTLFFNNLADSTFEIKDGKKSICSFASWLSPVLDWHLNKKADLSEYNYTTRDNHFILEIFFFSDSNSKLIYDFKITGDKPQIIFKKSKKNWFEIKSLKDLMLDKRIELDLKETYESGE